MTSCPLETKEKTSSAVIYGGCRWSLTWEHGWQAPSTVGLAMRNPASASGIPFCSLEWTEAHADHCASPVPEDRGDPSSLYASAYLVRVQLSRMGDEHKP